MASPFGLCWMMSPFTGNVATWVEWKTRVRTVQFGTGAFQATVNGTANDASNESYLSGAVNVGVEGIDSGRVFQCARVDIRSVRTSASERKILTWFRSDGTTVGGWVTILKNGSNVDLKLYDKDGNLLGTATGLTEGSAVFVPVFLKLGWDGANGTLQLRVNTGGTVVGSTTLGYDPRPPGMLFNGFKLGFYDKSEAGGAPSPDWTTAFDDWVWYGDTEGFVPNGDVFGPVRANGAGTPQEWTVTSGTHHAAIDDPIDAPTDTDYIEDLSNASNTDDYFTHGEATSSGTTRRVSALFHMIRCEESASMAGSITLLVDTTEDAEWESSSSWQPVGAGFTWYPPNAKEAIAVTEKPASGLPWDDDEFNNMEYGYRSLNLVEAEKQRISTAFFYYDKFVVTEAKAAVESCVADKAFAIDSADKDSYVAQGAADTNYGSATVVNVGQDNAKGGAQEMRAFLYDGNVAVTPPAGRSFDKVELNLWITVVAGAAFNVDFKRTTAAWVESTITWNNQPAVGTPEILGAAAPTATLTWWKKDCKSLFDDAQANRANVLDFRASPQVVLGAYFNAQSSEAAGPHRGPVIIVTYTFEGAVAAFIPRVMMI